MNALAEVDVLPEKPYPGLRAFEPGEWAIYFGREKATKEAIGFLLKRGLVLIHGASGCGKSSLVRAGVLPSLEIDHEILNRRWRTAVMRPSEGPLTSLVNILERHLSDHAPPAVLDAAAHDPEDGPIEVTSWHDHVFSGRGLVDAIETALAEADASLCIVVDQFEEIFRWSRELGAGEQASVFVDFLRATGAREGREQRLFVILTMRSDYLGHCARFDRFAEFLNNRQYLLPKIDEFGLLCAIHEPAALYGGKVDDAVANRLLPMVAKEQDGLPVMQHALMRAWEIARKRNNGAEGWRITVEDLDEVGGAQDALAVHAEQILRAQIERDARAEQAAEWMFRALTDLDADRRAIRRPCRLRELLEISGVDQEVALSVINAFRASDCCFLSPYGGRELADDTEIDISHEALIRRWGRLNDHVVEDGLPKGWLDREFQDGLVWRLLAVQAQAFKKDKKNILSPASTKSRGEWFEQIKSRRAWINRHAITASRNDPAALDDEWHSVTALMRASERNLRDEETIIERLRVLVVRQRWMLRLVAVSLLVAVAGVLVTTMSALAVKNQKEQAAEMADVFSTLLCARDQAAKLSLPVEQAMDPTFQATHKVTIERCAIDLTEDFLRDES